MRDLILSAVVLGLLPAILRFPACGIMTWAWFSILSPHEEVFGFAQGKPFGLAIAVATLLGWLVSRERKRWTPDAMPWLMLAFLAWMTVNSAFAPFPDFSWPYWNQTLRIFAFVFMVFVLITNKARIHAMIWALVISVGYYGVKGGVFVLATGGATGLLGPVNTILYDNNQLALAVVVFLPLLNYLRLHTRSTPLRVGMAVAMALQVVAVLGSYSRGGAIALGVMLALFWWRSDRKVLYGIAAIVVVGTALSLMPPAFWARMSSIQDASQDASFHGRVVAWQVATLYALEHFPFGDGFAGAQLAPIFLHYFPDESPHAAHSIYFEVLGDHGFPGLALYLLILGVGLRNTFLVVRQTRGRPGLRWAYDLARMLQASLVSFYVGGAALSMAYFDAFLALLAVLSTLRELTRRSTVPVSAAAMRAAGRQRPPLGASAPIAGGD